MSEIKGDYRPVSPIQNFSPKPLGVDYAPGTVRCEDCPAAKICKKIDNFRPSCDPMSGKKTSGAEGIQKCLAGTNILLYKLIEIQSMK